LLVLFQGQQVLHETAFLAEKGPSQLLFYLLLRFLIDIANFNCVE
jgi:hypothetical protein